MLDYALAYARQGFPVFPLAPNGKTPLTRHGFHDATADEGQIEQWWSRWPEANIGIPTGKVSGLLVVDVDRHGDDGTVALRELNLPPTRAVKTPRDGCHLYFKYPKGAAVGRLIGVLPGIDLLGDNGYVVACGSRVDDKLYELIHDFEPVACPSQLLDLAARRRETRGGAIGSGSNGSGKVSEGQRNDFLASVAGALRRDGFGEQAISAVLEIENHQKCWPPLDCAEVARIAHSIARYQPERSLEPERVIEQTRRRAKLEQLAKLSRIEYDQVRATEAKQLGIRALTLDKEVSKLREEESDQAIAFEDPESWHEAVSGTELLSRIRQEVEQYVVLPPHASTAVALWSLHTWCVDAFYVSPFLFPRSPEKRCGKSTLMMVLHELVRRPLIATSATPAAIFRCIEKYGPTLLLDEADTWMRENEELRGILNGGHSRRTAQVLRIVGDEHEVHTFSTFCPKAISGIGRLVDTLEDRSIIIPMQRKRSDDPVKRLREDQLDQVSIRSQCRRWAGDHLEVLRQADPATPLSLNDRAADNWRSLLAIADLAGGDWPRDARAAALALSADPDDEAIGVQLLADIRTLFDGQNEPEKPIASATLVYELGAMEERPWSEWRQGKPITAPQLARLLKPFSIRPRNIRIGTAVGRGYHRWQFEDVFGRYLPEVSQTATPLQQQASESETSLSSRYG
jgi:putative DNA primase/helicase